jgi:hypothetical protein
MLGGGTFITQSEILPGAYINFVSSTAVNSAVGERGIVAIALPLNKNAGKVIELHRNDFIKNAVAILGHAYDSAEVAPLREIFCNANRVYIYDLGTDGTVANAISALEAYEFNILVAYTNEASDITSYITAVKEWRDEMGKKCQVVVYNQAAPDYEGVINVVSTIDDESVPHALVAWVGGAEAGCKVNASCTNMAYNGEYNIIIDKTQKQLEQCITNGQIAFHLVYGEIRMLEDINSLTSTSQEKGEDFKSNQTIRVIDQIANDIARLFNTKYLGKIANTASGRVSLWGDIVAHHRDLEAIGAIENFSSTNLTVAMGANKKSVVINDLITVTNAMAQMYMTIVVQ